MDRTTTDYPSRLAVRLRALHATYEREAAGPPPAAGPLRWARVLKYYQFVCRAVMTDPDFGLGVDGNARGLLVNHEMGMGKTVLAVAIAMSMAGVRPTIVILAKSLERNFAAGVEKVVRLLNPKTPEGELAGLIRAAQEKFQYVALDAYNMSSQVDRAAARVTDKKNVWWGSLDGKLLIIDEAHNFFRAIVNGAKNAREVYERIMESRDLRLVFLTGTISTKHPFELVPCFNMLAGWDLLPSMYDIFTRLYVDAPRHRMKNRAALMNRLFGMVSHADFGIPLVPQVDGKETALVVRAAGGFPEVYETEIVEVEMSAPQYRRYLRAREREQSEGGGGHGEHAAQGADYVRQQTPLTFPGGEKRPGSSYHVRSRTLSNFAAPPERAGAALERLPDAVFTPEASPKAAMIMRRVAKSPGPVLIYSQFVEFGGKMLARYLDLAGYAPVAGGRFPATEAKRYAIIHGGVPAAERAALAALLSDPRNRTGTYIRALIVSKTGAEGLSLRNIRQTHQMEPYWDAARARQVRARAARLSSHDDLPPAARDVRPYIYVATANRRLLDAVPPADRLEQLSIDERFIRDAMVSEELNEDMRALVRAVSIECAALGRAGCRVCAPTGDRLFHKDPAVDIGLADPCRDMREETVAATRVVKLGDDEYRYVADASAATGHRFFAWNDEYHAYVAIPAGEAVVAALAKRIGARDTIGEMIEKI